MKKKSKFTIGILLSYFTDKYQSTILSGIIDKAKEEDINLVCFVGGAIYTPFFNHEQKNIVYELICPENIDGLICMTGALGTYATKEQIIDFYEQFGPIPIVSVGEQLMDFPSVIIDNEVGMRHLLQHLVDDHSCKNIAFLGGTYVSPDANARFNAYKQFLAEYDIPYDPHLVVAGDFDKIIIPDAISQLLDHWKSKFDALVCVDDFTAFYAIQALHERGIRIPDDVAVTGFDDIEQSKYISPPLTTINQPLYNLGYMSVDVMLSKLRGGQIYKKIVLPTELVIRRSCGCFVHDDYESVQQYIPDEVLDISSPAFKKSVVTKILKAMKKNFTEFKNQEIITEWAEELFNAFLEITTTFSDERFIKVLKNVIGTGVNYGINALLWRRIVSILFSLVSHTLISEKDSTYVDKLWEKTNEIIDDISKGTETYSRLNTDSRSEDLQLVSQMLITTFGDMAKLKNVIDVEFSKIGIKSCYISLFDKEESEGLSDDAPALKQREKSKLMLSYGGKGDYDLKSFDSKLLIPGGLSDIDKRFIFIVYPLYLREEELGFVVFEFGPMDGRIYQILASHLSSTLKGARLVEKVQKYAIEMEEKVKLRTADLRAANEKLLQEIREKQEIEEALYKEKELALVTLKSIGDGVIITDVNENVTYLNPIAEVLTGWMNDEVNGLPLKKIFDARYANNNEQNMHDGDDGHKSLDTENILKIGAVRAEEMTFKSKDDRIIPISLSASVIPDKDGSPRGIVYVVRDITERKRAEEKARLQQQQLIQAGKMASLGILVSGVAHEINNPNNFIMMNTPALKKIFDRLSPILEKSGKIDGSSLIRGLEYGTLKEKIPLLFDGIINGAKRIKNIVNELKTFAREDSSNMSEAVDINEVVQSSVMLLSNLIKKSTTKFNVDYAKKIPVIAGNYQRIEQVVINLVQNACQALEDPSKKIEISTRYDEESDTIVIEVIDEGVGIKPEALEHIKDPFFTTKREKGGTGLGLSISSTIIEEHNGVLNFTSAPGEGTTAVITLPVGNKTKN